MLSLQLAWRQFRQGQQSRLQRFLAKAAIGGVALGCLVLVLVLSVMNGFEKVLTERFLSLVPQVELIAVKEALERPKTLTTLAAADEQVLAVAPFRQINALASKGDKLKALDLRGIELDKELKVSGLAQLLGQAAQTRFNASDNSLILGKALAAELAVQVGDPLTLLVAPPGSHNLSAPRRHRMLVTGIVGVGGQLDHSLAYMPLATANAWAGQGKPQGLRLRVSDVFQAQAVANRIGYQAHEGLYMDNWTRTQGHLYQDIQMVRVIIWLVVGLIMLVASFNIISLLMVTVREEAPQIAMLRSMGLARESVLGIYLWRGLLLGGSGMALGVLFGLSLSAWLPVIAEGMEQLTGSPLLSGDIYFTDKLPTQIRALDVWITALMAMVIAMLATLYPAWKASRLAPAQVLSGA
ncbi:FtsX-like permease family protein [Gallaecimonas sp. GXIMD4217]|uniref:FtsX-like permease family protein n=1 Tax=Gallaecimonas sp. GXIMD4217 TaxID=3131927 RepID=UPI00311B2922